jgi:hypothetical protein
VTFGRSTRSSIAAVSSASVLALVALTWAGCAGGAERALIGQFFAASRLRDLTALHSLATIVFEPKTDGIVADFDVLRIDPVPAAGARTVAKRVLISAAVRVPDGTVVVKTFVVTMRQGGPGSDPRWGRWMITAIQAGPASPSTPPS